MKKRKDRQHAGSFRTKPFHELSGVLPPRHAAGSRSGRPAATAQDSKSGDDAGLFLRAVEGVKKLGQGGSVRNGAEQKTGETDLKNAESDKNIFLDAIGRLGATPLEKLSEPDVEPRPRSADGRMRQLKRGAIAVSDELDLHGALKEEALLRLAHFITAAYVRGRKAVLVITGKGINSPEGPVLRGAVAEWLRKQGKGMVAEFGPAPRDKGGSGAFVVFLKGRKGKGTIQRLK